MDVHLRTNKIGEMDYVHMDVQLVGMYYGFPTDNFKITPDFSPKSHEDPSP